MIISRPAETEFAPYYASYIERVGDRGPLAFLHAQVTELARIRGLADAKGDHRYAEGKWSVKELLGHLADAERVFAYRLLRIARADKTPLPGFDENAWAEVAPHGRLTLAQVVDDLLAVRRATITLVESLDGIALGNVGVANNHPVSARAICWIITGHAQHHLGILTERYGV